MAHSSMQWAYDEDLFGILGVPQDLWNRNWDRTRMVNYAYRVRCQTVHPDKGGDQEQFQLLNCAYLILGDYREYAAWRAYLNQPLQEQPFEQPREIVEARGPLDEESARIAVLLQAEWLPRVPRRDPRKREIADRRVALKGFQFASCLARFFEPVLEEWATSMASLAGQSYADTVKEHTFEGYDVHKNRVVDYGNRQYRAVLHLWCYYCPDIVHHCERAATAFEALNTQWRDSNTVLDRQGDIIEIMLALCRAHDCWNLRRLKTNRQWMDAYIELLQLCRSVDYLFCHATQGKLKTDPFSGPCRRPRLPDDRWGQQVLESTYFLAALARQLDV